MKKLKNIIILMIIFMLFTVNISRAEETPPSEVQDVIDNFMSYLSDGNAQIYYYMDTTNTELYNNIQKYLHAIDIKYETKEISKNEDNSYTAKLKISAEGTNWSTSGRTIEVKVKDSSKGYVVSETSLFDVVGLENVGKSVLSIFGIIGIVIAIMFILAICIVAVIVIVSVKKNRKNVN